MGRFAYSLVVLALSLAIAPTASAQQPESYGPPAAALPSTATAQVQEQPSPFVTPVQQKRPAAMVPLYAGFATVQLLDYRWTTQALSSGAGREGNPVMAPVAGNHAAFFALKAGSVVGAVWVGEKLWKHNRIGAIVFMVAIDSAVATVAAHNYSIVRR